MWIGAGLKKKEESQKRLSPKKYSRWWFKKNEKLKK